MPAILSSCLFTTYSLAPAHGQVLLTVKREKKCMKIKGNNFCIIDLATYYYLTCQTNSNNVSVSSGVRREEYRVL